MSLQGDLEFRDANKITFIGGSSNTLIDLTTGSLGVGVTGTSLSSNLHVVGNAFISSDLTVSGTGALTVPAGTTENRPATAVNGMIRYNSTTGFMEAYSAVGWAPIAQPPTVTGISPLSTLPSGGTVPGIWTGEVKHVSPNPIDYAYFGHSVSMSSDGTKFIVGAVDEDFSGHTNRGAAYIFTYSGGSWDAGERIINANGFADDRFGHSVAMSSDGTKVIVGEFDGRLNGSRIGAAHIFTYDASNTTWGAGVQINAQSGATNDHFGQSVAMSSDGTKVIVGAHNEDTGSSDSGAAFIYTYDSSSSTWGSEVRVKASDAESNDYFGTSVAMDSAGTTVIVGAPDEDTGYATSGAAYIYTYNGSTWSQQQKIQATSTTAIGDKRFGHSVDVSGDGKKFIVGAYWEDTSGSDAGSAYIYTYDDSSWGNLSSSEVHLANPDATPASDQFGWSVAMSTDGTKVIVGAKYEDTGGGDAGSAYIYTYDDSSWGTGVKLLASDKAASDYFGYSVAMNSDGSRVIIGANQVGAERGAAYFYKSNQITDSGFVFDASTQVFTATGTGIVSGSTVQLEGANGTFYSVFNATPPNAAGTQITFKMQPSGSSSGTVYPDIDMTSASQGGYVVTAHTEGSGSEAMWKAFDGNSSSTYWKVDNGYSTSGSYLAVAISGVLPSFTDTAGTAHVGHWIQLELPKKIKLTRFVTAANFANQYFMKSYVVLGSNDNTSWTLLHSEANGTGVQDVTTLSGGSTSFFKYFKLLVKSKLNGSSAHLQIGEVEYYGILYDGRFEIAQQPYKVRINSTSGLSGTSTAVIGFPPIWTTAVGANLNFDTGTSTTQTLVGTDVGGGTNVTFSNVQALPSGLTLIGSSITGQIAANQDGVTTSVTFRLTDNATGLFTDRVIDIVGEGALYAFTSHTFTPAGKSGQTGPSLSELRTAYSPTWTDYTSNLNVTTQGVQSWTVPSTGNYTIKLAGASGGYPTGPGTVANIGGFRGIEMSGTYSLTKSEVINIIVGQHGEHQHAGGGGGGSFVYRNATDTYPICVAGGGGSISSWASTSLGSPANQYTPGAWCDGQSGTSGGGAQGGSGYSSSAGGTGGNGGAEAGSTSGNYGGGGAGWLTDGADAANNPDSGGHAPRSSSQPGYGGDSNGGQAHGGFGGGGGTHGNTGGAGGGGGYSGGGGGGFTTPGAGGGGGSYGGSATGVYVGMGSTPIQAGNGLVSAQSAGDGYVIITKQ